MEIRNQLIRRVNLVNYYFEPLSRVLSELSSLILFYDMLRLFYVLLLCMPF